MRRLLVIPALILTCFVTMAIAAPAKIAPAPGQTRHSARPIVQVALLLDTSNSMDGLIDQAKSQLWRVVNELSLATWKNQNPEVYVALYEYGNDRLDGSTGYIRKVLSFTDNLDTVSENLFALTTLGGSEYCGTVIRDAVTGLNWSHSPEVYKVIFIAGNEPFTQGNVPFRESAAAAADKGIIVNTIFCGPYQEGISTQWMDGARSGHGDYFNIDHGVRVVSIAAPQDDEILRLNNELNQTYIAYGEKGKIAKVAQEQQDSNQISYSKANLSDRATFKASKQYSSTASSWDVVSAVATGNVKAEELKKEDLPKEMQSMSPKEREKYINDNIQKRKDIQTRINALSNERRQYVAQKEKEAAKTGTTQTLDTAIIKSIHSQAAPKGYKFK
ncbi:MAG: VWA domain-containing protein [bacterium]|nr:VWA domain-containing protein [bacterium]